MKKQIEFIRIIGTISIGNRATLELTDGKQVQTSSIISIHDFGIETKNTMYIKSKRIPSIEPFIQSDYNNQMNRQLNNMVSTIQNNQNVKPASDQFMPIEQYEHKLDPQYNIPVMPVAQSTLQQIAQPVQSAQQQVQMPQQPVVQMQPTNIPAQTAPLVQQPQQVQPVQPVAPVQPIQSVQQPIQQHQPMTVQQINNLHKNTEIPPTTPNAKIEELRNIPQQKSAEEIVEERYQFAKKLKIVGDVASSKPDGK